MNSSLIGKIEKSRRYADERNSRLRFTGFRVHVEGENGAHEVRLDGDKLTCACDFFAGWGTCTHTMTMERVLGPMLPSGALSDVLAQPV